MSSPVVFFDLWGTLLFVAEHGPVSDAGVEKLLGSLPGYRLGVLCNAGPGRSRRDVLRALEDAGIAAHFEPELVIAASDLPTPLPDRHAFAVAAALADCPIDACVFVSRNAALLIAAAAAGMKTVAPNDLRSPRPDVVAPVAASAPAPAGPGLLAAEDEQAPAPPVPMLLAGEVDEDVGPTFVLIGRVVTMDGAPAVIDDGRVIIRKGKIFSVGPASAPLPDGLGAAKQVDTGGTIYPGLIDLHNHFAYNVLPLWKVPLRSNGQPFANRSQWPRHREYKPNVTEPIALMAGFTPTAEAIVRYVEAKAIIGGTTTGQGIRGKAGVQTTPKMYRGMMRNVEETNDPRLPEAGSMVPNLQAGSPDKIEAFRRALQNRKAHFYHLSEGVGDEARSHYLALRDNDLIQSSMVGIHALGLEPADLRKLGDKQAKIVWSPYSNRLLYKGLMDLAALKESGVVFAIGCDWTPTGSKNLLLELKVARFFARQNAAAGISSQDLVRAVTADAARVLSWEQQLGKLRAGNLADLVVIAGKNGDPFDHLIDATEADVALVVIHGIARYGDKVLFDKLHATASHEPESLEIGGKSKRLLTFVPDSQINHVSLATAQSRLEEAMGNLPAFKDRVSAAAAELLALGISDDGGFTLVLDNEFDEGQESPTATAPAAVLLAEVELPQEIELDGLEVNSGTYWERVESQPNLPQELKQELKDAYQ
jgi:cytosine/adenosine deaminase-related metal-dependent hydrolase